MLSSHAAFIRAHETSYGAKLGELKNPPTQRQLDEAFVEFQHQQLIKTGQRITAQKLKKQQKKKGGGK